MARRPKPALKSAAIRLRASEAQKAVLEEAARDAGISLSSWLLHVGLKAATEAKSGK